MLTQILTAIGLGYGFGCLQFSYFIIRLFKKSDIREMGNGNAGASNAAITFGLSYGALIAVLDIGKAVCSLLIIRALYQDQVSTEQLAFLSYLNGCFVILGHNFPFFMGYQGGKGTASLLGMLLVLDYRIGILGIVALAGITILTNYIALGAIGLVVAVVAATIYFSYPLGCVILALLIAAMSIYKHIPNIRRIRSGEEKGLRGTLKQKRK